MKKLKKELQCNYIYYILFTITIIYSLIYINFIKLNSVYDKNNTIFYGYIISKKVDGDKLNVIIKSKEKLMINYRFKTKKEKEKFNLKYGDYIKIIGNLEEPKSNTNFNLFNYKKYLYYKKIYYVVNTKKIVKKKNNTNILFTIKNFIEERCNKCTKTNEYVNAFILGNKDDIQIFQKYQNIGISHLFAISGMHIMFIVGTLEKIIKIKNKIKKFLIIDFILIVYTFITSLSSSIIRASFMYILNSINKIFNLKISSINILLFLASILLIINPFNLCDISFQFSFVICIFLMMFKKKIKGNYLKKSLIISSVAFLSSFPIVINNYYEINCLTIVFNLIYVPFISLIIFPLGILTFLFPMLDSIYYSFIRFLENLTVFFDQINLKLSFSKIPIQLIVTYYILLFIILKKSSKRNIFVFIIFFITLYFNNYVVTPQITFFDVGQGDSSLIRIYDKNILIDTGGVINYKKKTWQKRKKEYNLTNDTLVPSFKLSGVKRIHYLIITHGDADHCGEAINLVNNIKIEKVIFNCGPFNDLEQELIKVLDKKNIKYYSCIKELNIDKNKLYFLQTKEYDNENDNSNVIYTELNSYKFMFMGDAGIDKERDILDKYNISDVDVLKVGHHGSKTSSGIEFINYINPRYSIISVGKKNRYGHPNKGVLDNLENSKIYRTDQDGSIMFKIKNNKLKIETCTP